MVHINTSYTYLRTSWVCLLYLHTHIHTVQYIRMYTVRTYIRMYMCVCEYVCITFIRNVCTFMRVNFAAIYIYAPNAGDVTDDVVLGWEATGLHPLLEEVAITHCSWLPHHLDRYWLATNSPTLSSPPTDRVGRWLTLCALQCLAASWWLGPLCGQQAAERDSSWGAGLRHQSSLICSYSLQWAQTLWIVSIHK